MTIRWCGTGLSSGPGLRRLIEAGHEVVAYDGDLSKAAALVGDLTDRIGVFDADTMPTDLAAGDIVVSMLPASMHTALARQALAAGCHFISSSYLTDELEQLGAEARERGVAIVTEVGLDPGIDHLMAHDLVARYRTSAGFHAANTLSFTSFCGGFPAESNAFRYKFSWSPVGVFRALMAPARAVRAYSDFTVRRPWSAIRTYDAPLPGHHETFEVYPNRDSVPFMAEYGFEDGWTVREFERGTLRPLGWADAWSDVFAALEDIDGRPDADERLSALAERYWDENAYAPDEADRVVLCVSLRAEREGAPVFHQTWALDATGDLRGSAMARLVSGPVSLAAEAILTHDIGPGVHRAPSDPKLVSLWLDAASHWANHMAREDHLRH